MVETSDYHIPSYMQLWFADTLKYAYVFIHYPARFKMILVFVHSLLLLWENVTICVCFFDIDKACIVLHEKWESSRNKIKPKKILFHLFYHLGCSRNVTFTWFEFASKLAGAFVSKLHLLFVFKYYIMISCHNEKEEIKTSPPPSHGINM